MKVRLEWVDEREELLYDDWRKLRRNRQVREFDLHGLCKILGECNCEDEEPRKEDTLDCE